MKTTYIARSDTVASRILAGEMIIMSAADSTLYSLNPVATAVWQAADGCTPLAEIVNRHICAEFDVSPDEAYGDVEAFVADLARRGILLVSDRPILEASAKSADKS
jgi:hypothetical protein